MTSHDCEYIVDFDMGSEGEPIFCGLLAVIKHEGAWFCAGHYDAVASRAGGYVYRQL